MCACNVQLFLVCACNCLRFWSVHVIDFDCDWRVRAIDFSFGACVRACNGQLVLVRACNWLRFGACVQLHIIFSVNNVIHLYCL